jgi:hypothetical protein
MNYKLCYTKIRQEYSGPVLSFGQKLALNLLAIITHRAHAPSPALPPIFKSILENVFFVDVLYLDHLNCAEIAAFQFYLLSGK